MKCMENNTMMYEEIGHSMEKPIVLERRNDYVQHEYVLMGTMLAARENGPYGYSLRKQELCIKEGRYYDRLVVMVRRADADPRYEEKPHIEEFWFDISENFGHYDKVV